jgi:pyruvate,water dikinase
MSQDLRLRTCAPEEYSWPLAETIPQSLHSDEEGRLVMPVDTARKSLKSESVSDGAIILPLKQDDISLDLGGGKGANLARLLAAGFPVPGGLIITTRAYQMFVAANELETSTLETARNAHPDDLGSLDEASRIIRGRFEAGLMPPELRQVIGRAYASLGGPPVAVRSSATTEDLPEASFAGQQDTFLNVAGEEALIKAVVLCWSSLWTARAIGYRSRNGIDHQIAALAVVVQEMVASEVSGVLFTANPLTGRRTETVIDATMGLGEALVSGQVDPDHYVVDPAGGRILKKTLGQKQLAIRAKPGGGTGPVTEDAAGKQALPDATIRELAALGQRVARLFGMPQDIEWAWANQKLYLVQSRPITSLFPIPEGMASEPLQVLVSFGAVQGMLDPITPLGRDVLVSFPENLGRLFGLEQRSITQRLFAVAAERLFINVTGALRRPRARQLIRSALKVAEPEIGQVLEQILSEPALAPQRKPIRLRTVARSMPFLLQAILNLGYNLLRPEAGRRRIQRRIEAVVQSFRSRSVAAGSLGERIALTNVLGRLISRLGPVLAPGLAAGLGALRLLHYLLADLPDGERLVLETTRGLANNVTTQMDLALWRTAEVISRDPAIAGRLRQADVATLAAEFLAGKLPGPAQTALGQFLDRYGMRGIAEIDIGRPRWREDPRQLIGVLQSYLGIEDVNQAPPAVFERGAASAEKTIEALVDQLRGTRHGWLKSRLARWAARRVRELAGLRESPKFTAIRLLGILRQSLQAAGRELTAASMLAQPDDIFFLHLTEIQELAERQERDCRDLIEARRIAYEREMRRRQVPRVLLSDGRTYFDAGTSARSAADGAIVGSPVSPGIAEGSVRVVFDPHSAQLAPGEILVCRGTDPAWTPLFLSAAGLVMEVGGLMTHGSVVAREYGIPAVVGVHQATTRLKTGQRVRIDGSRGSVDILNDGANQST